MSSRSRTVLVTGGTGTQGGIVIRELLLASESYEQDTPLAIHALVRDVNSKASQALVGLNPTKVKLFQGDFDNVLSISAAAQSCTTVFINVSPSFEDKDAESRHARNILSGSLSAGIKHVILSSVASVENFKQFKNIVPDSWIDRYFTSKAAILDLVKRPPFPTPEGYTYTILLPATFLSNFIGRGQQFMYPTLTAPEPSIETANTPTLRLSYLDHADIGRFAARSTFSVLDHAQQSPFANKEIPLASVHLTISQVADALSKAVNHRKTVSVSYLSPEEVVALKPANPFVASQIFQNENPYLVDLEQVRTYGIELGSVDAFFERERERVEKSLGL